MTTTFPLFFSIAVYQAQLQAAPPLPPDNVATDQDRQTQHTYEEWLNQQHTALTNQQNFYETEVLKLRKTRKSLNSKKRVLVKAGNDLTQQDSADLVRVTAQQTAVQKQLESSRKQSRQHGLVMQDYKSKHQQGQQQQQPQQQQQQPTNKLLNAVAATSSTVASVGNVSVGSPVSGLSGHNNMAPQSPLMSPSPSSSQQSMMAVQSPLSNPMLHPGRSPLHSPSPMMSQSPGPGSVNSIMQSPGPQGQSSMSPFSTMQPSPRIGTPHSQGQLDQQQAQQNENPFSPQTQQQSQQSAAG